ncbi:hypothetical protein H9P43_001028 [Blastocladiella emersonii ATCC 22665]|nr:hypothetical protein H9P43_001028 [Blastocladiella emersonii ATCC 22665]
MNPSDAAADLLHIAGLAFPGIDAAAPAPAPAPAAPVVPVPAPTPTPAPVAATAGPTYRLEILQQPVHCRVCGYNEKDRRPVDPPVVLQLVAASDTAAADLLEDPNHCALVAHATLWSEDGAVEVTTGTEEDALALATSAAATGVATRSLMGSLVASGLRLLGLDGRPGIFFAFHDLSVRVEGRFRLRFALFDVRAAGTGGGAESGAESDSGDDEGGAPEIAAVMTDVFTSYAAKRFPGMMQSTALSKHFRSQGVKVPTRAEARRETPAKRRLRGGGDASSAADGETTALDDEYDE